MQEESNAGVTMEELQLAARNHGMPLEALRYPVTPAGLHYLLVHYDIPAVEPGDWRLTSPRACPTRTLPLARGAAAHAAPRGGGDHGVRRQWARSSGAAPDQPAVARRGDRHRALAGRLASGPARGGRPRRRRHGDSLHRPRPRSGGRGRATLRAQRSGGRGGPRRGRARLRAERRASSSPTRVSASTRRSGVVRDDEREMARQHHRAVGAVRGVSAGARDIASGSTPTTRGLRSRAWFRGR